MRGPWRQSLLVSAILACATAHAVAQPGQRAVAEAAPQTRPAQLFLGAKIVKLYAAPLSISVTAQGAVQATARRNGQIDDHARPIGGVVLTQAEIAILRQAVFYSQPPKFVSACCIPRHAFVFFDGAGTYLGYLKLCFQCGCAETSNPAAPPPGLPYLAWNAHAIGQIVRAHNIPITFSN